MKPQMSVFATAAITAAALMGCSSKSETPQAEPATTDPQTQTVEISYDDLLEQKQVSRSVNLSVGDFLQVSLGSNASTGDKWSEKMLISDPEVMAQTGHEALPPVADRPGAPGKDVWVLQAMAPGNTTVSATYGEPWPGGDKDIWVFTANVDVS